MSDTDTKFQKTTDETHVVTLDSYIVSARWISAVAPAGQNVELEVLTAFVGNGAPVQIKLLDADGKTRGKTPPGQVRNNAYRTTLAVPEDVDVDDELCFEANLSKHDLSVMSDFISVVPEVVVENLAWSANEVHRGDIVTLSANVTGCKDDAEAVVTIYEFDGNKAHDRITRLLTLVKQRKIRIEWEFEYQGDTSNIADAEELKTYGKSYTPPQYFFEVEIRGKRFGRNQESGLMIFRDWIEIEVRDKDDTLVGGVDYTIDLADGSRREGKLNSKGFARIESVPPGPYRATFPNLPDVAVSEGIASADGVVRFASGRKCQFDVPALQLLQLIPRHPSRVHVGNETVKLESLLPESYAGANVRAFPCLRALELNFYPDLSTCRMITACAFKKRGKSREIDRENALYWRLKPASCSRHATLKGTSAGGENQVITTTPDDIGLHSIEIEHPAMTPRDTERAILIQASRSEQFADADTAEMKLTVCRNDDVIEDLKNVVEGRTILVYQRTNPQPSAGVKRLQYLLNQVVARHKAADKFEWVVPDGLYSETGKTAVKEFLEHFKGDYDYEKGRFGVAFDDNLKSYLQTEYGESACEAGIVVDRSVLVGKGEWKPGMFVEHINGLLHIYDGVIQRFFEQIDTRAREYMEECKVDWLHDPRDYLYTQGEPCVRVLKDKKLRKQPDDKASPVGVEVPAMSVLYYGGDRELANIVPFVKNAYRIVRVKCDGVWFRLEVEQREGQGYVFTDKNASTIRSSGLFAEAPRRLVRPFMCMVYEKPDINSEIIKDGNGSEVAVWHSPVTHGPEPIEDEYRLWYLIKFTQLTRYVGWVLDATIQEVAEPLDELVLSQSDPKNKGTLTVYSKPDLSSRKMKGLSAGNIEVTVGTRIAYWPAHVPSRKHIDDARVFSKTVFQNPWYLVDIGGQKGWISGSSTREIRNDRIHEHNMGSFGRFGVPYSFGGKDLPHEFSDRLMRFKPIPQNILCWDEYNDGYRPGLHGWEYNRNAAAACVGCDCSGFVQHCATHAMHSAYDLDERGAARPKYMDFREAHSANTDRIVPESMMERITRERDKCISATGFIGKYAREFRVTTEGRDGQCRFSQWMDKADIIATSGHDHVGMVADRQPNLVFGPELEVYNEYGVCLTRYEYFTRKALRMPLRMWSGTTYKNGKKWLPGAGTSIGRIYFWH
jgi:hypothetical protein